MRPVCRCLIHYNQSFNRYRNCFSVVLCLSSSAIMFAILFHNKTLTICACGEQGKFSLERVLACSCMFVPLDPERSRSILPVWIGLAISAMFRPHNTRICGGPWVFDGQQLNDKFSSFIRLKKKQHIKRQDKAVTSVKMLRQMYLKLAVLDLGSGKSGHFPKNRPSAAPIKFLAGFAGC